MTKIPWKFRHFTLIPQKPSSPIPYSDFINSPKHILTEYSWGFFIIQLSFIYTCILNIVSKQSFGWVLHPKRQTAWPVSMTTPRESTSSRPTYQSLLCAYSLPIISMVLFRLHVVERTANLKHWNLITKFILQEKLNLWTKLSVKFLGKEK